MLVNWKVLCTTIYEYKFIKIIDKNVETDIDSGLVEMAKLTQSPFHCGYCTRQALINDLVWNSCPSGDGDFRVDQDYSVATPIDFRSLGEDSPALT